ncbi:MAG: AMP-binding protein, partial [Candidatus Fimadaptatus sp.]
MYKEYVTRSKFSTYEDFLRNFRLKVPERFNFAFDVVDRMARECPNDRALLWVNPQGDVRDFTFADIARESDRTANMLREQGIGFGDKVMLILKRHYEFWFCILALHKLGAVAIPATNQLQAKDIVYRCNSAEVKMIITTHDGDISDHINEALPKCPSVKKLIMVHGCKPGYLDFDELAAKTSCEFTPGRLPENSDPMLLYFTSGTSGMPKMVQHDYKYPLGHIITAVYWLRVEEGGLHLTVSETGWAKSVWGKLYGQWLGGSAIFVYDFDRFHPTELLDVISKYKVTTFCAPPTIYRFMIHEDVKQYDLSNLHACSTAGEPLNPEVFNRWKELTGLEMRECFGQTELVATLCTFPWMKICPGSMGKPAPIFDVDLIDENDESCAPGKVGEIVLRTGETNPPGMFMGYYKDDEMTNSVWHDGIYHTGDLAWRDEWGYYWYVGRADDVIKSSGYRIGPFEVESALMEHPAVLECAITAVPDPVRGQVVKATIVLTRDYRDKAGDELVKELQNHVKRVTAPYKYPRIIEFVDTLPKT